MSEQRSHKESDPCRKQEAVGVEDVAGGGISLQLEQMMKVDMADAGAGRMKGKD